MISRRNASISKFIIHKVGNKFNDTKNAFSEKLVDFDEASYDLMLPFLLRPFSSVVQSYRFNHHANISLNEINSYCTQLFNDEDGFVEISKHIVTHLYEQSSSAQIKTGDVLVVMFEGIEFRDMTTNAIGIFKIESKVNFFQTYLENRSYDVLVQKGINSKKVDKGCLILNQSEGAGLLTPGQAFTVDFDWMGTNGIGGVIDIRVFSELSGGGVSKTDILAGGTGAGLTADWTNFGLVNLTAGADVSGGLTVEFTAICGADAGCFSNLAIDNVTVTADVSAVPVPAAVWLFGSGLLGLVGVARRKTAA